LDLKAWNVEPALRLDFIHYTENQPGLPQVQYSETAVTVQTSITRAIGKSRFEVGADPALTLVPLSKSGDASVRYLDLDFKGGYSPLWTDRWKATFYAGYYYQEMLVSPSEFGFTSMSGPLLQSDVTWRLNRRGDRLKVQAQFEPVASGLSLYGLNSLGTGIDFKWERPRRAKGGFGAETIFEAGVHHSQLGFDAWQTSATVYSLGIGLCF
jgi:hypothetical protein